MLQFQIVNTFFAISITYKDCFVYIFIPPGAYEIRSLIREIKRIISEEKHFTEAEYPFLIKANLSFVGSIKEICRQVPLISFLPDGIITDLLGFIGSATIEEYKLSSNPGYYHWTRILSNVITLKE